MSTRDMVDPEHKKSYQVKIQDTSGEAEYSAQSQIISIEDQLWKFATTLEKKARQKTRRNLQTEDQTASPENAKAPRV